MSDINPGLLIGLPTLGRPTSVEWAMSFKNLNPPINYNSQFQIICGRPVADARNEMANHAMKIGSKYLLFVGDDTIMPAHALRQFIYRMENNPKLGVVGGVYCTKSDPSFPLVFRGNGQGSYWDWKVGEYFPVTGLGMDATMIRVEVFRELLKGGDPAFFKTVDTDSFLDGVNHTEMWTEDLYFLNRVQQETKWQVYCDASVICGHYDYKTNKTYGLPAGSLPTRVATVPVGTLRGIDIGCGPSYIQIPGCSNPIRVDIDERWNPDYRCDVRQLPFAAGEFDVVHSSHVLEHFYRAETDAILKEWVRILKPDGEFILCLPNLQWAIDNMKVEGMEQHVHNVLYGGHESEYDVHHTFFTPEVIEAYLTTAGLRVVSITHSAYNMRIVAKRRITNGIQVRECPADKPDA